MRKLKSFRRSSPALWEVKNVRYENRGYEVKIKLDYGISQWLRISLPFIYVGEGNKKLRLNRTQEENINKIRKYIQGSGVMVRIPELERRKEVKKKIRKEQKKLYKKIKRW